MPKQHLDKLVLPRYSVLHSIIPFLSRLLHLAGAAALHQVGAKLVPVQLQPPNWDMPRDQLAAAFTDKTKFILVNTPHNPTGKVRDCTKPLLQQIVNWQANATIWPGASTTTIRAVMLHALIRWFTAQSSFASAAKSVRSRRCKLKGRVQPSAEQMEWPPLAL